MCPFLCHVGVTASTRSHSMLFFFFVPCKFRFATAFSHYRISLLSTHAPCTVTRWRPVFECLSISEEVFKSRYIFNSNTAWRCGLARLKHLSIKPPTKCPARRRAKDVLVTNCRCFWQGADVVVPCGRSWETRGKKTLLVVYIVFEVQTRAAIAGIEINP